MSDIQKNNWTDFFRIRDLTFVESGFKILFLQWQGGFLSKLTWTGAQDVYQHSHSVSCPY